MGITKGPWKLINQMEDYLDMEGDGIRICSFYIGDDNPDLEETKANTQAIAALPELIEALEEIHTRLNDGPLNGLQEWIFKAGKILQKAKGKE